MNKYRSILTICAVLLAGCLPAAASGTAFILCFHTFLGTRTSSLDFSLPRFAAELDEISSLGYKFVTLDDAIAGRISGSANVVITIDDGNHSVYNAYKKVLAPRGIKPELFIPTAIVDHHAHALTWPQIRELASDGCGIAAHGYYHLSLSAFAFAKDRTACLGEIEKPAPDFVLHGNRKPDLFAYPFGLACPAAESLLANNGYAWAFLAGSTLASVRFDDASLDRYAVPRTIVYHWNFPVILAALKHNMRIQKVAVDSYRKAGRT